MTLKRFVAILAILTTLSVGTASPKPARAAVSDTTVIVISSIAAYVAFVFIGAWIVYGRSEPNPTLMPAPADFDDPQDARNSGMRPGYRCRQADGNLTLVCW